MRSRTWIWLVFAISVALVFLNSRRSNFNGTSEITADIAILNSDLSVLTAMEFRQALDRHFPITELIDEPNNSFHKDQLRQIVQRGDTSGPAMAITCSFCRYLEVILPFDCAQTEKNIFCAYIVTLLKLRFESPEEDAYTTMLQWIIDDTWLGWRIPKATWDETKSAWINSELCQYLQKKKLPKSTALRNRILYAESYKRKYEKIY